MKKFTFASLLGLAVPAVSFADIATGPDFSSGSGYDPIILGVIVTVLVAGIVLMVRHFKKRNVNLSH